ncbi:tachylectin-related carbohydrate-binding protein [Amycolatopsis sp. NPDC051071]|uniref:tachylectin-related carbohydrate-binding protein n=1 Tax=Amycolatopsis sp. NPDC051071 TaxID=3154637 RepID=UPI003433EE32
MAATVGAQVASAETITCRANAGVFYTKPDTVLELDRHNEPETGANSWTGRATIGNTWFGKTLAGPDGRMYLIADNGDVTRQRRLATGWENGGAGQVIATGWYGVTLASQRNRITVDSNGDFFWSHDGILAWLHYDEATKVWTDRLIDTGWTTARYDLIVGAGAGVFYARTPAGALHRFQYDAASQRWIEYGTVVSTNGWQYNSQVAAAGGDIIYAIDKNNGQVKWHRYLGGGAWTPGPKIIGTVGADWQLAVTTDDCKLNNNNQPTRPTVPTRPNAATNIIEGAAGRVQYFYTDDFGRLIHGRQRTEDTGIVEYTTVPGYQQYVGTPSAARAADDTLRVAALGKDSDTRTSIQAPNSTSWASAAGAGGWTPGPAVSAQRKGIISLFATDAGGKLWVRDQDPGSKQFLPWRVLQASGLSSDVTAVAHADGIDLLVRTTLGAYTKSSYVDGVLGPWITVPGTGWTNPAAAVANPDNNLQAFAVQPDGSVVTQRETADGFTGTWKVLPGVVASGTPAVAMDAGGIVHVAVRANDGYVYQTEQQAPASGAYRTWERLADSRTGASYQTATDPSMVSRAAGGVVATFRDLDGISYIYASAPPAAAARSLGTPRSVFTGGPVPKPNI